MTEGQRNKLRDVANEKLREYLQARAEFETASKMLGEETGLRFQSEWDDPAGTMQFYSDSSMPADMYLGPPYNEIPMETKPTSQTSSSRNWGAVTTTTITALVPGQTAIGLTQ
jgi:hypothetical protein